MDYSKLSDFEINNRVAKALGAKQVDSYENGERCAIYYELGDEALTVRKGQALVNEQFDPCNNAADAWPILFKNLIGIEPLYEFDDEDEETSGGIHPDGEWEACHVRNNGIAFRSEHGNPLRAAMIVYLMMQEGE